MSDIRLYDSQTSFQGGMQKGFDASLVADTQYYRGINVVCRDGTLQPRPSFKKVALDFNQLISDAAAELEHYQVVFDQAVVERDASQAVYDGVLEQSGTERQEVNDAIDALVLLEPQRTGVLAFDEGYDQTSGVFLCYVAYGISPAGLHGFCNKDLIEPLDPADAVELEALVDSTKQGMIDELPALDIWLEEGGKEGWDMSDPTSYVELTGTGLQPDVDRCVHGLLEMDSIRDKTIVFKDLVDSLPSLALDVVPYQQAVDAAQEDLDNFIGDDLYDIFLNGKFQGAEVYKTGSNSYSVVVISGHVFLIDLTTNVVTCLTTKSTQLHEFLDRVWMVQAESYFIIQDGVSLPRILEGSTMRFADHEQDEVPIGQAMSYGHGRLSVQINDRHLILGDIYISVKEENVLRFRETKILNEGGGFTVQSKLGSIVALLFINVSDTSTGDGPLLVVCENGFTTLAVNNSRSKWSQIAMQKVQLVGSGMIGLDSFVHVNEDLLYRSTEGIRSYAVSRAEAAGAYRYTELSREVEEYMQIDKGYNAKFLSMAFFDKRMLASTAPQGVKAQSTDFRRLEAIYNDLPTDANRDAMEAALVDDTCFRGIIAFDFSMAGFTKSTAESQYMRQTSGSYDGIWTGICPTKLFTVMSVGERVGYSYVKNSEGQNWLYEITRDVTGLDGDKPIECLFETRAMTGKNPSTYMAQPFVRKKLEEVKMWLDDVSEDVTICIESSPDVVKSFEPLGNLILKAKTTALEPTPDKQHIELGPTQARGYMRIYDMQYRSDKTTQHPMRLGDEFIFRVSWSGMIMIRRFFVEMRQIEHDVNQPHEIEQATYPFNLYDYYSYRSDT